MLKIDAEQIKSWKNAASKGDHKAEWWLAYAYYKGIHVQPHLNLALDYWQRSETYYGEEAWLARLKALNKRDDVRIHEVYAERLDHSNGIACFTYGAYLRRHDMPKAIQIYAQGKDLGHFSCEVAHLRYTHLGIRRLLAEFRILSIMVRAMRAGWRDKDDPRWKI